MPQPSAGGRGAGGSGARVAGQRVSILCTVLRHLAPRGRRRCHHRPPQRSPPHHLSSGVPWFRRKSSMRGARLLLPRQSAGQAQVRVLLEVMDPSRPRQQSPPLPPPPPARPRRRPRRRPRHEQTLAAGPTRGAVSVLIPELGPGRPGPGPRSRPHLSRISHRSSRQPSPPAVVVVGGEQRQRACSAPICALPCARSGRWRWPDEGFRRRWQGRRTSSSHRPSANGGWAMEGALA